MPSKKITILGSGAMGSACASILANNKHEVIIYGIDNQELTDLQNGKNSRYFKEIELPKFKTTTDLDLAIENADYILFAIPTKFIPAIFELVVSKIKNKTTIINVAKGFWPEKNISVHEQMQNLTVLNDHIKGIVSLIGPSFAIDMVAKNITLIDAVSTDLKIAQDVQKLFSNSYFRVYTQTDVKGAETGSIFKNMYAIAAGLAVALGYSTNTQVALLTKGLQEMSVYNKFIGGKENTIYGLTGLGDLILTALSEKSRNYQYGLNFFNNNFSALTNTVEGLKSIEIVYDKYVATKVLNLPIVEALYEIIYKKTNPKKVIENLMNKELKNE
ncbi:NAD(P)H-dependent glycerol-3-phosphate dehydrogenase [[Mycoplasma] falconis]|uniref:Glycerol-3-phosphate dehydrogenase n=1 Tax=[Mycoplasma] falconis TaxID=92403 RepID=A0A501XA28_9BACT|nr:NAD(P)H-dependent glycerol-3-phosphate dehydrogenase [[Mycoplasma] falconis]TPE57351.1 NAD(P)H-dependent glycerol-3-phosphate dehydrogenase [[Mycoplasma] falconis]